MLLTAGGFIKEALKFKDWSHEIAFGPSSSVPIIPLGRSAEGLPIIFQGEDPSCVSCTVTWIKQWQEKEDPRALSWKFLSNISGTGEKGVVPSKVLETARKIGIGEDETGLLASSHKIPSYFYVSNLRKENIYSALCKGPLMIGVDDWQFLGPHMMAGFDVTADGNRILCANWKKQDRQDISEVPFEDVSFACLIAEKPSSSVPCSPVLSVISSKIKFLFS